MKHRTSKCIECNNRVTRKRGLQPGLAYLKTAKGNWKVLGKCLRCNGTGEFKLKGNSAYDKYLHKDFW